MQACVLAMFLLDGDTKPLRCKDTIFNLQCALPGRYFCVLRHGSVSARLLEKVVGCQKQSCRFVSAVGFAGALACVRPTHFAGSFQEDTQALADGTQSELLGSHLIQGQPRYFAGIVTCFQTGRVAHFAAEKHVERGDVQSAVSVLVGQTEHIFRAVYLQVGFLSHLPDDALFTRLVCVGEAAGKVKRSFSGVVAPPLNQQFAMLVEDEGHVGGAWVHEIHEVAVLAPFALLVVHYEVWAATRWAEFEFFQ